MAKRSPSYPGIPLDVAIQRADEVWRADRANDAPVEAILRHWGYKGKSGAALVALAALGHFGLLEFEGNGPDRVGRLTDLAQRIILDPRIDGPERAMAIQEAALAPAIHREVWAKYSGDLPSNESWEWDLVRSMNFTPTGAREFIRQFRKTVAFAGLSESAIVSPDEEDSGSRGSDELEDEMTPPTQAAPRKISRGPFYGGGPTPGTGPTRTVNLPTMGETWATLEAPYPMTSDDWDIMIEHLQSWRRTWVKDPQKGEAKPVAGAATEEAPDRLTLPPGE